MEYRRLGRSGLSLSALSFGSWVTFANQLDEHQAGALMKAAYDAGVNFFDNAEAYAAGEAERIMGRVFRKFDWPRDTFCVSSKVFFGCVERPRPNQRGLSRKHVIEACHQALQRLQVDYLDIYLCHRPDPESPIEETVWAMDLLVRQGKVLYWGTSEWSAQDIIEAYNIARNNSLVPPTLEQPQYNMLHRDRVEKEYLPLYSQIGLGTTVWSPLCSGVLTGKYNAGIPPNSRLSLPGYQWLRNRLENLEGEKDLSKVRRLGVVARSIGVSMPQMAIAWCLLNPGVSTVILGASRPEQFEENLQALDAVSRLTRDVIARIEQILANRPQ